MIKSLEIDITSVRFIPQANAMTSDSFPPAPLKEIVNEVATLLKEKKETVAVAETVRHSSHIHHHTVPLYIR